MKILLDAGHGPGKFYNRGSLIGNEGDNNFLFSMILKSELEKYDGVEVALTRQKITDNPSLKSRGKMAQGCDLFLSLHSNAFNGIANGFVLFDDVTKPNDVLARALSKSIGGAFRTNRGVHRKQLPDVKDDWYAVLRYNEANSGMLLEYGFHDNLQDVQVYTNMREMLARLTAQPIVEYYKLKLKEPKKVYKKVLTSRNTDLWDLNAQKWSDFKSVKKLSKGTVLEVADIFKHKLGSDYYRTPYSVDKGLLHGVNVKDCEPYFEWFQIGSQVVVDGYPYLSSYGGVAGVKLINFKGTIDRIALGRSKPYHILGKGWVDTSAIK